MIDRGEQAAFGFRRAHIDAVAERALDHARERTLRRDRGHREIVRAVNALDVARGAVVRHRRDETAPVRRLKLQQAQRHRLDCRFSRG